MVHSLNLKHGSLFNHRGKKYKVRRDGVRTLNLLRSLALNPTLHTKRELLRLRPRIRYAGRTPVLLSRLTERLDDPFLLRIVLMMLGRCGSSYAIPSVMSLVNYHNFRVQRAACRTLHRLEAWSDLRWIASEHENATIRAMAQPRPRRTWESRLGQFLQHTEQREVGQSEMKLNVASELALEGRQPRSGAEIRRVLLRIRRWIRLHTRRTRRRPCWLRHA